jgi:hypothetical protein
MLLAFSAAYTACFCAVTAPDGSREAFSIYISTYVCNRGTRRQAQASQVAMLILVFASCALVM